MTKKMRRGWKSQKDMCTAERGIIKNLMLNYLGKEAWDFRSKSKFLNMRSDHILRSVWKASAFLTLAALSACGENAEEEARFQLLTHSQTGLEFGNELRQTSEFNVFNYMYFFNGGGVAAGDFNQDGLPDLYFTANMGPNKLFLNRGDLQFEDVTPQAGVAGTGGWKTGVTVVDINQDGLLDLYVCEMGDYQTVKGKNLLFVNQGVRDGIPVFEEKAADYGLDLVVFGTQATFFDFDLDGDLDLYLLNHSLHANGTFGMRKEFAQDHPKAGDRLFRNDGGSFTDITQEAGINSTVIGYGLGIVTGDVNLDGWPDIYVGNDFHENDYLYINQQDGTFKEDLTNRIRHTSRFTMGVDMADINNDGFPEVLSLDMLPDDPFILKSSLAEDDYNLFHFKLRYGYNYQFARNNLQLNNGDGSFSEIGLFAGVEATDWSWAVLFQDFDHDGLKDIFVSNGIPRRMNDIDYVNFRANNEIRWKQQTDNLEEEDLVVVEKMPQIKIPNKFFRNQGELRFQEETNLIENNQPSYSNGAVYVDLDLDGDLDVVVNNLEDEPFVYQNLLMERKEPETPVDYLSLELKGPKGNLQGIGARLLVEKSDDERLFYEYFPVRGYQSCSLTPFHVPIGDAQEVEKIRLIWPDNRFQTLDKTALNQKKEVIYGEDLPRFDWGTLTEEPYYPFEFEDASAATGLDFVHKENYFSDFDREGLIPWMVTAEGPAAAVGDLNGDGLDDLFFGSSKNDTNRIYLQQLGGQFRELMVKVFVEDKLSEDVDAQIVDLDGDGLNDILVAAGGNEFWGPHQSRKQRIYWNRGNGTFDSDAEAFGDFYNTPSTVEVVDLNGDGRPDVFFGGRSIPWNYGQVPESALFLNEGGRRFRKVTEEWAPGLKNIGLIRDASTADLDQDGDQDLLLALDWGPVVAFLNEDGKLQKKILWEEHGWWNTVLADDFDGDGDLDLMALGIGENAKLRPTAQEPVRLYLNDYDGNGKTEQVLTYYLEGKEYPFATYAELTTQIPGLKKRYLYAKDLARAELSEIFGAKKLASAERLWVEEGRHILLENKGDLTFTKHVLPDKLQFSSLNAVLPVDLDQDGKKEWIVGGNFYRNNIEMGRYDANAGNLLEFDEQLNPEVLNLGQVRLDGVVQHIRKVHLNGELYMLFVFNDGPVRLFKAIPGQKILSMQGK